MVLDIKEINSQKVLVAHIHNQEDGNINTYFVDAKIGVLKVLADGSDGGKGRNGGPGEECDDGGGGQREEAEMHLLVPTMIQSQENMEKKASMV